MRKVIVFLTVLVLVAMIVIPAPTSGQDETHIKVNLTPYPKLGEPILTVGEASAWDSSGVALSRVVYSEGVFHMLYLGWTGELGSVVAAVGYATSEDGLKWNKYDGNPVFVPDKSIAPNGMQYFTIMLDGKNWVMYFTPFADPFTPSQSILRATAPSPTGPWTVDPEPVTLVAGTGQAWDRNPPAVESVLHTDEGYVMYYAPVRFLNSEGVTYMGEAIGRATSPDGIHWTKYDDPATTDGPFATSDPVFLKNTDRSVWDSGSIGLPVVRFSERGWEMFYYGNSSGWYSTGYATSEDGITWTRYGDAPVLAFEAAEGGTGPHSVVVVDDTYYLYFVFMRSASYRENYLMEIGVATGTIMRE
jgi:hypothetical protein